MTIKKAKTIRFFLRLAFTLIGFATPIILMLCKFDFKASTPRTRFTFIGVVILLLIITLLWKFKKKLLEYEKALGIKEKKQKLLTLLDDIKDEKTATALREMLER